MRLLTRLLHKRRQRHIVAWFTAAVWFGFGGGGAAQSHLDSRLLTPQIVRVQREPPTDLSSLVDFLLRGCFKSGTGEEERHLALSHSSGGGGILPDVLLTRDEWTY